MLFSININEIYYGDALNSKEDLLVLGADVDESLFPLDVVEGGDPFLLNLVLAGRAVGLAFCQ